MALVRAHYRSPHKRLNASTRRQTLRRALARKAARENITSLQAEVLARMQAEHYELSKD